MALYRFTVKKPIPHNPMCMLEDTVLLEVDERKLAEYLADNPEIIEHKRIF